MNSSPGAPGFQRRNKGSLDIKTIVSFVNRAIVRAVDAGKSHKPKTYPSGLQSINCWERMNKLVNSSIYLLLFWR